MTTIAYRDGVLAVDGRVTTGVIIRSETQQKLYRVGDDFMAVCGGLEDALLAVKWYREGGEKPTLGDDFAALIKRGDRVFRVESKLVEWEVFGPVAAGTGFEVALGAMAAGATAVEAVRIAARFDVNTNDRIRTSQDPDP